MAVVKSDHLLSPIFREAFERFDKDKSGTISRDELGDLLHFLGLDVPQSQIDSTVRNF